jgi:serine protease Do
MTFKVPDRTLTTRIPQVTNLRNSFTYGYFAGNTALGASVQELSGQLGEYFGASNGVLVTNVEDGSVGKTAGLKAGDVITKINGSAVTGVADLRRNLSGDVTITIVRDKKEQTIKATIK